MGKIASGVPLDSDTLREIADAVDRVVTALKPLENDEGVWQASIEISRGADVGEPVGEVKFYDGWFGFYPYQVEGDD